jgi:homoserine dehydrogenase
MNVALIGFGTVGRGFVELLHKMPREIRLVAVVTGSRGTLYDPTGLDLDALLAVETLHDYPDSVALKRGWDATRIARQAEADVLVEASPTNLKTGQPALDLCLTALDCGKHLILANKGPVALAYTQLQARAQANGRQLRAEATVMAGTPALRLGQQYFDCCKIERVRGILNGTTNYMLSLMEAGRTYEDALHDAQARGYVESDPGGDVEGWDAAAKAMILSAVLFDQALSLDAISVTGITAITPAMIQMAKAAGMRYKLVAEIDADGAWVAPVQVPLDDPLAHVSGTTNAISLQTDVLGTVTLTGPGAGGRETGFAILADLLDIAP